MKLKKLSAIISLTLCFTLLTNSTAFAVKTTPDSDVESISIFPMYGILEGQTRQMSATVDANGSFFDSVEWSSSNPGAISCTEDGKICGLIAGESAIITCKAKWGSAKDTIKVYCAEKIPSPVKCTPQNIITTIYAQPSAGIWSGTIFSPPNFLKMALYWLYLIVLPFSSYTDALVFNSKLTVYGRIKNYAYVRYGESEIFDGFVKYTSLPVSVDGFLELSAKDIDLWADDITYTSKKLTAAYDGDVEWDVSNEDYISFDETTGQLVGKSAGAGEKVTITAKADGMTKTCTIHLLYKWPQAWTTKTNKDTHLYKSEGNGYTETRSLPIGREFVVRGDCGTNDGWVYGYFYVGETQHGGYIPIADVSTKGTISQYNNLGWTWPVKTATGKTPATFISSPYGWRDTNPKRHQGIDITTGTAGEIKGYEVVSAFDGTVDFICDKPGYDWGYCIAIRSNIKDPISGKQYIAVYMHLEKPPKLIPDQSVAKGTSLGTVGNTTTEGVEMGYHLHFEFNNQNSSIALNNGVQTSGYGRKSYDYLINPIFLYIDEYEDGKISYNKTSDAEVKYMKTFWYGNGDEYSEAS